MTIRTINGKSPDIDATAYVDESAIVIGNVSIGKDSSLWPLVVARGSLLVVWFHRARYWRAATSMSATRSGWFVNSRMKNLNIWNLPPIIMWH